VCGAKITSIFSLFVLNGVPTYFRALPKFSYFGSIEKALDESRSLTSWGCRGALPLLPG